MLKQMLLIGAAAVSFPALAQTAEPAGDKTPPVAEPAPTDSTKPAPADKPTDKARPAPTDRAPADGDTPEKPVAEPKGGA